MDGRGMRPSIADASLDSSTGSMDAFWGASHVRFGFGFVSNSHAAQSRCSRDDGVGGSAVENACCRSAAAAAPAP